MPKYDDLLDAERYGLRIPAGTVEEKEEFVREWKKSMQESNVTADTIKAPPIGIKPRYLIDEARLKEIDEAIMRYVNALYHIPTEWLVERNEIITRLEGGKKGAN